MYCNLLNNRLGDELDRRTYGSGGAMQYSAYNSWSPPAQSNETSNGYFLERSPSARLTLRKANELLPEDVRHRYRNLSLRIRDVSWGAVAALWGLLGC